MTCESIGIADATETDPAASLSSQFLSILKSQEKTDKHHGGKAASVTHLEEDSLVGRAKRRVPLVRVSATQSELLTVGRQVWLAQLEWRSDKASKDLKRGLNGFVERLSRNGGNGALDQPASDDLPLISSKLSWADALCFMAFY